MGTHTSLETPRQEAQRRAGRQQTAHLETEQQHRR
jgi:hypothetical protein